MHGVGILEFVYQDVPEAFLVMRQQARVVAPQIKGTQQQLGKIDHTGALARDLIGLVNIAHGGQEQVAAGLDMFGAKAFVFLTVDKPLGLTYGPALFIQPQLTDHTLDQALLVVAVEDLECLAKAGFLPVSPQQTVSQAVEGAYPHACRVDTHQLLDAVAHLGSGLVGERHRQHRVRGRVFDLDQPGDTVHQHTGFAGTSAGQDQLTPDTGRDGLTLGIVERI